MAGAERDPRPRDSIGRESRLRETIERESERLRLAERERPGLLAQTAYLGSLAVLFIVPVIAGAYLGRWIDEQFAGYSVRWTISLLLVGVAVGGFNVYLFVRERS
jgi:ATP synthase protein I